MNILFDLDGTLIDSSERMYRLFQHLVPESELTKDEYWKLKRGKVNHQMILKKYFPQHDFDKFNSRWMSFIESEEYLKMDGVYPGTVDVLDELSKKYGLVLLTARQSKNALEIELEGFGIRKYFNLILITEKRSSKEELIRSVINNGTLKKTAYDLFVSDMGKDIQVGRALGYKMVAVTYGFMSEERLREYHPDYIIRKLRDIEKIVSWSCG